MPKGRLITLYEWEKKKWIAKKLNRDYSIIKREIKRNSEKYLPYNAKIAQSLSEKRARRTNIRKLDKSRNVELKNL